MDYIAHRIEETGEEQSVKAHLCGTAELAKKFAEAFDAGEYGYCAGILHDIGKYSEDFQKRIRGADICVDHSTAGAEECWNYKSGNQLDEFAHQWLAYCIAGHHAGLPDGEELADRVKKELTNGKDYHAFSKEVQVPVITKPPFTFQEADQNTGKMAMAFFTRMIFSCLVDADFLDTESFMSQGHVKRDGGESISVLYDRTMQYFEQHGFLTVKDADSVNGHRTEILKHCIKMGTQDRGLFRLTVPTGGGKTTASLAFALRHAKEQGMDRVIYVIPYTSIIEQNSAVFRKILGDDNVLENHCHVEYKAAENGEELDPMQLAAENWDKPVVVTTNVQFFESLFASRTSKCRKLHNIANSVIIFDEAQMLPLDYLTPCLKAITQLLLHYHCSAVLCTATQPALKNMLDADVLKTSQELCPDVEEQFRFFKRVQFKNLGTATKEELVQRLENEKQALCIVNTRKEAQDIYKELEQSGVEGLFHLSTTMAPMHRKSHIETIRQRLRDDRPCIVVSTSLVEAGVDFDFHSVYREIAGVDSMIQAAGRCNREGKRSLEESPAYLFSLKDGKIPSSQRLQVDIAKEILDETFEDGERGENGEQDLLSPEIPERYFKRLYHGRGPEGLDKKEIMKKLNKTYTPFKTVANEFKLIENQMSSIFIPTDQRAEELVEELRVKGGTRDVMRRVQQYTVQVSKQYCDVLSGAGHLYPISEDIEDFYVLRKDSGIYSEQLGLSLDVESGEAILM